MIPPVHLIQSDPIYTAIIRDRVPPSDFSRFVPAACGEVWTFVKSDPALKPGRHVALYLDAQGLIEVGVEVAQPFTGNDRIHCSQLPAGPVATTTHYGPYARLAEAHARIRLWCGGHDHETTGVSWEIYDHWDESWNSDPSKIRTDVFHLLT